MYQRAPPRGTMSIGVGHDERKELEDNIQKKNHGSRNNKMPVRLLNANSAKCKEFLQIFVNMRCK